MTLHRRALLKELGCSALGLNIGGSLLIPSLAAQSDVADCLPRSSPEAQGISSAAVLDFLDAAAKAECELHSMMLVRYGNIVAEGWWAPYRRDAVHSLYSLSKSFTSTAVGFTVAERKLSVSDLVINFFPDKLPGKIRENLAALRIEHLLTMSTGHAPDPTNDVVSGDDWIRTFLSIPIKHPPGSIFCYSSAASYMLSAIVEKVSGRKLIDYLEPRLFHPLEIKNKRWETCPRGINTGGWGLSVTTESLAKFGQFYLQRGNWNGTQLLPAEWIESATSVKIRQPASWCALEYSGTDPDPAIILERLNKTSDWHQGYGYQFWRSRYDAYRGDGALGQLCVVMPDADAVVAITSRTADMQGLLNLMWQHLLPAMQSRVLSDIVEPRARLKRKLASVALPPLSGAATSAPMGTNADKVFKLSSNELGAESVSFHFRGESCLFTLRGRGGVSEVRCVVGKWVDGIVDIPGAPPRLRPGIDQHPTKIAATGAWKDDYTFQMQWRYYETPHYDIVTCLFDGDQVRIEFMNDIAESSQGRISDKRPVLLGRILV